MRHSDRHEVRGVDPDPCEGETGHLSARLVEFDLVEVSAAG